MKTTIQQTVNANTRKKQVWLSQKIRIVLIFILCVSITGFKAKAQYCTPTYTNSCSLGDYIDGVEFTTISNTVTGCNGNVNNYIYYSTDTGNVTAGGAYPITLTPTTSFVQGFGVWIDYNADGDFADAGEFVFSSAPSTSPQNGNITIPFLATVGNTRMRG